MTKNKKGDSCWDHLGLGPTNQNENKTEQRKCNDRMRRSTKNTAVERMEKINLSNGEEWLATSKRLGDNNDNEHVFKTFNDKKPSSEKTL